MQTSKLWSLRLGYSGKQEQTIDKISITAFLDASFSATYPTKLPVCLEDFPKTRAELRTKRQILKNADRAEKQEFQKNTRLKIQDLQEEWLLLMMKSEFPLREKMTCFLHNHFVASAEKVKNPYWIYLHNQKLRENAFGNLRELTKAIIKSNAQLDYLDNQKNKKGSINENLGRELLELFTLGIGNYTESDITTAANALAGLIPGDKEGFYIKKQQVNQQQTLFNETKIYDVDSLVDTIFEQPESPYLFTKKFLQWFIADEPDPNKVKIYGDYLKLVDFELKPFIKKIVVAEFEENTAGSKIKDPLLFALQLQNELNIDQLPKKMILRFLKIQGMQLFVQPNVKGWEGGTSWLTGETYLQRNKMVNALCNRNIANSKTIQQRNMNKSLARVNFNKQAEVSEIIETLATNLLFDISEEQFEDFKAILAYDFNVNQPNADKAILRVAEAIMTVPEFQLI
jgi:uncharacterized protein (DUF1800 family)